MMVDQFRCRVSSDVVIDGVVPLTSKKSLKSSPCFMSKSGAFVRRARQSFTEHGDPMNAAPATVDEYIGRFPPNIQAVLRAVRATAQQAAPQAEERISYGMPALFQNGAVIYFGAFKNHLGLFPPVDDPALLAQVAPYAGPKGNLQFPYSQPMPLSLITAIVQARVRVRANAAKPAAKSGRSVTAPAKRAARRGNAA